ncbi:hypothetical protein pdam_00019483 [Pocillopora damicornis]|uniref:Uncharacterized protein n=1 Tax=Pocillopora damicornis TaxID=46731 RepID=A0A3M6U7K4_POCDA|nr:hypothetical protein pdam_00019483 [Pocillopora damicornis]
MIFSPFTNRKKLTCERRSLRQSRCSRGFRFPVCEGSGSGGSSPGFCCRKDADFNCQTDVCYARNVPIVTGTNSEIMNFLCQVGHHGNYTSFGINRERVIFG